MMKNLSFLEKVSLYLYTPIIISAIVQFYSLWDIDFFYIKFFSFSQLVRDSFFIVPIFFIFLLYFYLLLNFIVNKAFEFFIDINDIYNKYVKNKLLIYKYGIIFLTLSYFLFEICKFILTYQSISIFDIDNSYDYFGKLFWICAIPFILVHIVFYFFITLSLWFTNCCFDDKYKDEKFYYKFFTINFYINFLERNYKSDEKKSKEVDPFSGRTIAIALIFSIFMFLMTLFVDYFFKPVNKYIHEYFYVENLNFVDLNLKIKNRYLNDGVILNKDPKVLYMNGEYLFYEISIKGKNGEDLKKVLIIKNDELFKIKGISD